MRAAGGRSIGKGARRLWPAALAALALALAPPAHAERALLPPLELQTKSIPEGNIEGACGLAAIGASLYVSDYYHHAIDVFSLGPPNPGAYVQRISGNPLDGPCGLATSPGGALYAEDWHGAVTRLLPSTLSFGPAQPHSTGVAVDPLDGRVYVDERTHVGVYEPSGAAVMDVGAGTLEDGYGVAVSAGEVYVADAGDETVKVYEPAVDPVSPSWVVDGAALPGGGFHSLADAALAIDPTNQHLLVVDNLQPGFEHPQAVIDEFGPAGEFLGPAGLKIIDGEPSGLAFSGGNLYATTGNDSFADVVRFGPYTAPASAAVSPAPQILTAAASTPVGAGAVQGGTSQAPGRGRRAPGASASETIQRGGVRVSFDGKLTPRALPRAEGAPVRATVAARISSADGAPPPQLRQIAIAINRYGHFTPQGLPVCNLREIQPATTANALAACRSSLVGEGHFSAKVLLAQQAPFPAAGKVYAFNGRLHGRPAIFAHVYGTDPVPTSFTLSFLLQPTSGTFGTVLRSNLPAAVGDSGYVTGLSLSLGRRFRFRGERRSYLSASCPAPKGFPGASFAFAKASFGFAKSTLSSTLTRNCKVRR